MDLMLGAVSSAAGWASLMPIIARSVQYKRKIETVAQRLSTWDLQEQIYFTNERNMVLSDDSTEKRNYDVDPTVFIYLHIKLTATANRSEQEKSV